MRKMKYKKFTPLNRTKSVRSNLTGLKFGAVLLLSFGLTGLQAQEAIPAAGGEASGSGGSASYTVGQVVYTTSTGTAGNSIAQGVQQPYEISVVTGIPQAKGINLQISTYPNPATDYLILEIDASTSLSIQSLSYQLFDMDGKMIKTEKIIADGTKINTEKLVQGNYILRIIENDKAIKTFKIVKQ